MNLHDEWGANAQSQSQWLWFVELVSFFFIMFLNREIKVLLFSRRKLYKIVFLFDIPELAGSKIGEQFLSLACLMLGFLWDACSRALKKCSSLQPCCWGSQRKPQSHIEPELPETWSLYSYLLLSCPEVLGSDSKRIPFPAHLQTISATLFESLKSFPLSCLNFYGPISLQLTVYLSGCSFCSFSGILFLNPHLKFWAFSGLSPFLFVYSLSAKNYIHTCSSSYDFHVLMSNISSSDLSSLL